MISLQEWATRYDTDECNRRTDGDRKALWGWSEEDRDYLDKIDVSSKVLLNIINDILDMSSIENKKMKIAKEPFDLHEILMSVCTI